MVMAKADIAAAEGQIQQARSAYEQAIEELQTKEELQRRSPGVVAQRDIERLRNVVEGRQGGIVSAEAAKLAAETRLTTLLPAEKASVEAARAQAEVDLAKTVVYAGVSGRVEQFVLKVGDIVNPLGRPAGILVPTSVGERALIAGFGQIESQVMKVGMAAEVACASKPWTIIPMVVTQVQEYIAAGQVRAGEQLIDVQQVSRPGTLTVFMEPLYKDGLAGITPGSSCIANAYSSNHELLASGKVGLGRWIYLHIVDTVSIVHAMILRLQALVLPIRVLVFSGH
jgi:multidrug resistance efflux pump